MVNLAWEMINDSVGYLHIQSHEDDFSKKVFLNYNATTAEELKLIYTNGEFEVDLFPEHEFIQSDRGDSLILN